MYQIKDSGSSLFTCYYVTFGLLIMINLYAHYLGFYDMVKVADK